MAFVTCHACKRELGANEARVFLAAYPYCSACAYLLEHPSAVKPTQDRARSSATLQEHVQLDLSAITSEGP